MDGDMDDEYDEEEMDQDDLDMEADQDVKPDVSIPDVSVHEEENQENFDTDIKNAAGKNYLGLTLVFYF